MIQNIQGDGIGESLMDYYYKSIIVIKSDIDSEDDHQILNNDVSTLTEFYIQDRILPEIQEDSGRKRTMEKSKTISSKYGQELIVKLGIPVVLEEGIDKVVIHRSDLHYPDFRFKLEDGYLITHANIPMSSQDPEKYASYSYHIMIDIINNKNQNVRRGNSNLRNEISDYIQEKKEKLSHENKLVEIMAEKLEIQLLKKDTAPPIIDLQIKEKIKLIMPEIKKNIDPYLEKKQIESVINLLRSQGRQFEITPTVYSTMSEPELRDVMLSMLNAVFQGDATGETFVKEGKTDIHLKMNIPGGILSSECKFWEGEKLYKDTIDQHFGYLTWKQNSAIQITFSRNKGFSDVVGKAVKAAKEHPSYIQGSFRKMDDAYFITMNTFPNDSKKQIEMHHLLFDLAI